MKKLVLTLSVLMIAASIFAAPFNLSGRFEGGYKMVVDKDGNVTWGSQRTAGADARIAALSIADENDLWKLGLRLTASSTTSSSYNWGANLTANLAKAFELDEKYSLSYTIGRNCSTTLTSVYKDSSSTYDDGTGINATYSSLIAFGYEGYNLEFIGDPISKTFGVGANAAIVDGVKLSVGFLKDATNFGSSVGNVISVATDIDVQKLAGLDFSIGASAYADITLKDDDSVATDVLAEVYAGYDKVSGYVEYRYIDEKNGLEVSAGYQVLNNLKLSAAAEITDLENTKDTLTVSAGAVYKLGGLEYHIEPKYAFGSKTFTLPVYVRLNF
jgi:hypothetical protein